MHSLAHIYHVLKFNEHVMSCTHTKWRSNHPVMCYPLIGNDDDDTKTESRKNRRMNKREETIDVNTNHLNVQRTRSKLPTSESYLYNLIPNFC